MTLKVNEDENVNLKRIKETMLETLKIDIHLPLLLKFLILQHFWMHDLKSWILSSQWMKELM